MPTRRLIMVVIVLVGSQEVSCSPLLKQIVDWFSKIKYVPPHEAVSLLSQEKKSEGIFFREGDWFTSPATNTSYLVAGQSMAWSEARDWCRAQGDGSRLAEVVKAADQATVTRLLAEHGDEAASYWIGLRQPYLRWEESRRLVEWTNWRTSDPVTALANGRRVCTSIKGGDRHVWENKDCTFNHGFRPLCQRTSGGDGGGPLRGDRVESAEHCVVDNVAISLTYWLDRQHGVQTKDACHTLCLENRRCNFWSLDKENRLCYLKAEDSIVRTKKGFVSGTTLRSKGCNQLLTAKKSRVETCSCVSRHLISLFLAREADHGRHLSQEYDFSSGEAEDSLARFISSSACPRDHLLVCTDDKDSIILDSIREPHHHHHQAKPLLLSDKIKQPNITDCLVYDVRLATGHAMRTLYRVANAETCQANCLDTPGCAYWTWRGELANQACFLLQDETRMVRRAGSASGTVRAKYGCNSPLKTFKQQKTDNNNNNNNKLNCLCRRTKQDNGVVGAEEDWISHLGPRSGPIGTGRIVNRPDCPAGYSRVCTTSQAGHLFEPVGSFDGHFHADFPLERPYGRSLVNEEVTDGKVNFKSF